MADSPDSPDNNAPSPALARIDAALVRIEAVTKAQHAAAAALAQRHAALRGRMAEAVDALDAMIASATAARGEPR